MSGTESGLFLAQSVSFQKRAWRRCVCLGIECVVECVDDVMSQDVTEEIVDPNCGLHMSCTSSFANFTPYGDQDDLGITPPLIDLFCVQWCFW